MGKNEYIGEGSFNVTEKIRLNADITKCYLNNTGVKFFYLKTKKSAWNNAILIKNEIITKTVKYEFQIFSHFFF